MILVYKEKDVLFLMSLQVSAMPVRCSKCGGIFDLRHDMEYTENGGEMEVLEIDDSVVFTCWKCRENEGGECAEEY